MKDRNTFYVLLVFTLLLAIGLFFSLTHSSFSRIKSSLSKPKEIHVAAYGNYREEVTLKEVISNFMDINSDISVTYEIAAVPPEAAKFSAGHIPGYEQRLLGDFASGNSPDIFYIPKPRFDIYKENGALLDLTPYHDYIVSSNDLSRYALVKEDVLLGISSYTKYPKESYSFIQFMIRDHQDRVNKAKEKALEQGEKGLIVDSIWDNIESFENNWNSIVTAINKQDLVLWRKPKSNDDSFPGYIFFNSDLTSDYDPYAQLFLILNQEDSIDQIQLRFNNLHSNNLLVLNKLINLIRILIQTIHPSIPEKDIDDLIEKIGINPTKPSIDFFCMTGAVYFEGIEYTTYGYYDVPDHVWFEYKLDIRRMNQNFRQGPRRPLPKDYP